MLAIGVLVAAVFGASTAFFSDTETSSGNVLQAGGFDLLVNGSNDTAGLVNLANLEPNSNVTVEKWLKIETNPGKVWMHIKDVVNEQGQQTDAEVDEENGVPKDDLHNYLTYGLYFDESDPIIALADGVLLADAVSCWIPLGVIAGNQNVSMFQSFHFANVTNWAQGDRLTFTEEFWAVQDRNNDEEPPDTASGRVWSEDLKMCMSDLVGSHALVLTCTSGCSGTFPHTMNVVSHDLSTGDYSGTGFYDVDPAYTWDVTGNAAGAGIDFEIVYTGLNPGYALDGTGVLNGNVYEGSATSNSGQGFSWTLN